LYTSANIIRVLKSRQIRWVGHVEHTVEIRTVYTVLLQNLKGRDHLEDLGVDGKTTLQWILEEQDRKVWNGFIYLRKGSSGRLL
jgi:hypothetical protein